MNKWITDRNPEKPGEYLTVLNDTKIEFGYLFTVYARWDGEKWYGLANGKYQIFGWMEVPPLPTKPMQVDAE